MIMIQLNKPYTNKFIAEELLHIKPNTFNSKKQQYLDYLSQYYDYEITDKKKIVLKREIKPFKTKMQAREELKANQTEIYRQWTHKIIQFKPLNSGSNIAREINENPMKPIQKHEQRTIQNYVRPILKEDFEVINKKWCKINYETNTYEPLEKQELEFLYSLFRSKDLSKEIMEVTSEYKAGNISKQEFQARVGTAAEHTYDRVIESFKKKFGFRPIKASNWREKDGKGKVVAFG